MPAVHSRRVTLAALACAWLAALVGSPANLHAAEEVWALRPYRVRVLVAAEAAGLKPAQVERWSADAAERARSLSGDLWELTVTPAPAEIARLARAALPLIDQAAGASSAVAALAEPAAGENQEPFDKVVLVSIGAARIDAREWDRYTGQWGPPLSRPMAAGNVPHTMLVAVKAAVGGLARVELQAAPAATPAAGSPASGAAATISNNVKLKVRGGDVPFREATMAPVRVGDVLRVARRTAGPEGKPSSLTPVEHTYITVDKVTGADATGRVISLYRDPLAQPLGPRDEWIAVGVPATGASSTLKLTATGTGAPLVGYDVLAYSPGSAGPAPLGRTGPDGALEIPPGESPLRVLLVRHGTELMVRLPLVTGWPREATLTLAPGDERLAAEAVAAALRQKLLEIVTRREIELARIRARVKDKNLTEATAMLGQLGAFDQDRQVLEKLATDEQARITATDPAVREKAVKVYQNLLDAVKMHLDNAVVQQIQNEIAGATQPAPPAPMPTPQDPQVVANLSQLGGTISAQPTGTELLDTVTFDATLDDAKLAQALPNLKLVKNLRKLVLTSAKISDNGVATLKELTTVTDLSLGMTQITDAGVGHVAAMAALVNLELQSVPMSDNGLAALKNLKALKSLNVMGTRVTPNGVNDFKTAVPAAMVTGP